MLKGRKLVLQIEENKDINEEEVESVAPTAPEVDRIEDEAPLVDTKNVQEEYVILLKFYNQATIDDCLKECISRNDVKFFAYVPGRQCACYKTECLSDGKYLDHKAYEIVEDEMLGTNFL